MWHCMQFIFINVHSRDKTFLSKKIGRKLFYQQLLREQFAIHFILYTFYLSLHLQIFRKWWKIILRVIQGNIFLEPNKIHRTCEWLHVYTRPVSITIVLNNFDWNGVKTIKLNDMAIKEGSKSRRLKLMEKNDRRTKIPNTRELKRILIQTNFIILDVQFIPHNTGTLDATPEHTRSFN